MRLDGMNRMKENGGAVPEEPVKRMDNWTRAKDSEKQHTKCVGDGFKFVHKQANGSMPVHHHDLQVRYCWNG